MYTMLFVTILTLLYAVIALFRRNNKHLAFAAIILVVSLAIQTLNYPVRSSPVDSPNGTDLVYLGISDTYYIQKLRGVVEKIAHRDVIIVAPEAAHAMIKRHWPDAKVYAPSGNEKSEHGVTLSASLVDLQKRIEMLRKGGLVYLFAPRTNRLDVDKNMFDGIVSHTPWVAKRIVFIDPVTMGWHDLPSVLVNAPDEIDPEKKQYASDALFSNQFPNSLLKGHVENKGQKLFVKATDDGSISLIETQPPATKVKLGHSAIDGLFPSPKEGDYNLLYFCIETPYGEITDLRQRIVGSKIPTLAVLVGEEAGYTGPTKSYIETLFAGSRIQIEKVSLKLKHTTQDENAIAKNAKLLRKWGLILVDAPLTEQEYTNFKAALEHDEAGPQPHVMFIGTAGMDEPPAGWPVKDTLMHSEKTGSFRQVFFGLDSSGSMNAYHEIALRTFGWMIEGLGQRNAGGIVQLYDQVGNGNTKKYRLVSLDEFKNKKKDDFSNSFWESGEMFLVAMKELKDNKKPFSDMLLFIDSRDVRGGDYGGDDDKFTDEQIAAAKYLVEQGVRLHLISVAGDLHPSTPDFLKKSVKIKFSDYTNNQEGLEKSLKTLIFEEVLPRLEVIAHGNSVHQFKDVIENPKLRLINPLGEYKSNIPVNTRLSVKHFKDDRSVPLLQVDDQKKISWLRLDIVSELASVEKFHVNVETRNAIADLVITAINNVAMTKSYSMVVPMTDGNTVTLIKRNYEPFAIEPGSLEASVVDVHGEKIGDAEADLRRLTHLRFSASNIENDKEGQRFLRIKFKDFDKKIGEVAMTMPIISSPPVPIRSNMELSKFGKEYTKFMAEIREASDEKKDDTPFALPVWAGIAALICSLGGLVVLTRL